MTGSRHSHRSHGLAAAPAADPADPADPAELAELAELAGASVTVGVADGANKDLLFPDRRPAALHMDGRATFGPELHRLLSGQATAEGLLIDDEVLVVDERGNHQPDAAADRLGPTLRAARRLGAGARPRQPVPQRRQRRRRRCLARPVDLPAARPALAGAPVGRPGGAAAALPGAAAAVHAQGAPS